MTVVVLLALAAFQQELELTSRDPIYAESIGLRADLLRYGLLMLLALAVVVGIQAVGVVLTGALLVTPAAAASLVTDRLSRLRGIAILIAIAASVGGLYASVYWGVSSGASIVLCCAAAFIICWFVRIGRIMRTGSGANLAAETVPG